MGRWEPDARGRLAEARSSCTPNAASSRRRPRTSPQRAGVTERTFFRHFADKREVLFDGQQGLDRRLPGRTGRRAPRMRGRSSSSVGAFARRRASSTTSGGRTLALRRPSSTRPALQEREALKLVGLGLPSALRCGTAGSKTCRRRWRRRSAYGVRGRLHVTGSPRASAATFEAIVMDVVREVGAVTARLDR